MKSVKYFKNKLLQLRDRLDKRIDKVDDDIRHEGITTDLYDQAIELENEEVLNSLSQAAKRETHMINEALKRIDTGDYFTCKGCGSTIPTLRLEVLPYTNQCITCAEEFEH
ncbi:MAG: TraR/DksA C4-type zinc finger protein [Ghiorsea sp.]